MSRFEVISEHITIMHAEHESDRPILGYVKGRDKSLLIDAGNSPQHAALFQEHLKQQGYRTPDLVVLTHWHWDHTFGLPAWNVPVIAHIGTAEALRPLAGLAWSDTALETLAEKGIISDQTIGHMNIEYEDITSMRVILPNMMFPERLELDLGGVTCEVQHVGGDHAADSCFVYVREDKALFLGDALGPSVYGGPYSYTAENFLGLLSRMYFYDTEIYIESHGVPTGKAEFHQDIGRWEQFAEFVDQHGDHPEAIARDMAAYLNQESLPDEFRRAMDYFIEGLRRRT
ncbi:glyoxylase-like metal-dependent hydrolase (beta-lactamase superfamily II) [Fontibacillus phaseoli]|uniref:Glyoxylase-like metal-dependent hydrolase (Beta-lactamase superfamily II) n=1 Tax=Fontibacillus phaseoli TaxID=1416533 RepID=A0A369BAR9_9BACL|nr:MBL fold metallo-hydrolase [Fontibacillus phaseoli]RCX16774.1 glyoxylase-like metal-dependent hydrolase (beta-lactamase superfamily II) [Fontibacillus phaseoli]